MDTTKRAVLVLLWLIFLGAGVFTVISYINAVQDQAAISHAQFFCEHGATPGSDTSVDKAIDACVQAGDAQDAQIGEQTHELWGGEILWVTLSAILCIMTSIWAKNRRLRRQVPGPSSS